LADGGHGEQEVGRRTQAVEADDQKVFWRDDVSGQRAGVTVATARDPRGTFKEEEPLDVVPAGF
jgi:hypothetical protein